MEVVRSSGVIQAARFSLFLAQLEEPGALAAPINPLLPRVVAELRAALPAVLVVLYLPLRARAENLLRSLPLSA
jgi:hypothetical protein